jgi:GT2 family glycosyltransferase
MLEQPPLRWVAGRARLKPRVPATVVIPTALSRGVVDGAARVYLDSLLDSLLPTIGRCDSVVVVLDPSSPAPLAERIVRTRSRGWRVRFVRAVGPFSFSDRVNLGVSRSWGRVVILLNDDMEVISRDWVDRLARAATAPGVGAVGATLLYEGGTIQHAGVTTCNLLPSHAYSGWDADDAVDDGVLQKDRPAWAVTGACMAVSRRHWDLVGGFSEEFPVNYNDVDFCLKLAEAGLVNVMLGDVRLRHFESRSRGANLSIEEMDAVQDRWYHRLGADPLALETQALADRR